MAYYLPWLSNRGDPYDLYGTDTNSRGTIPFAVNWPSPPVTTTTLTVSNNTELATALATPGAEITVAAGSYNALNITSDDQNWIIDNGATFAGVTGNDFARVKISGGNFVTTGTLTLHSFTDLLMHNMNIEAVSISFGLEEGFNGEFNRLALVHCTIYNERTGFYTATADILQSDLILAANYVSGGMTVGSSGVEPAVRVQEVTRVILVDNRARCGFDGEGIKHTYRSHRGNQDFWMRRNLTEYGDGVYWQAVANSDPVEPQYRMGRHWCYDYTIHTTNLSAYALRAAGGGSIAVDWPEPIVVDGNVGYTDMTANDDWLWQGQAGDSIGSNTTNAYTAPPALGSWLAADGLPPGADH